MEINWLTSTLLIKRNVYLPVGINNHLNPNSNRVLGMNIDATLRWSEHLKKHQELEIKKH